MSSRRFSLLLAGVVAAVVAVVLLVPSQTAREGGDDGALLFPELARTVNSARSLTVERFGADAQRLHREDTGWVIASLHGYPADFERVRTLLADLAAAKVVERKTANPAYYDRLGVEDPAVEGAAGALLRVGAEGGDLALVVGKRAAVRDGQYVRVAGVETSLLVDREFELPAESTGWAERSVADIPSGEVAEVEVVHPDGDRILTRKAAASDADFQLVNLPEGREPTSSWSVNSLAGGLSALTMESVRPARGPVPDTAVAFRALTFGGVDYMARLWAEEDAHWIALSAAAHADATTEEADAAVAAMVEAFNARVEAWWYRVADYEFNRLTRRLDDLLQPRDGDAPGES